MKVVFITCFISALIALALLHFCFVPLNSKEFITFYKLELRNSFFSGFLTVGGLLLTLKTFVITHMKEHVYDSDVYKERYKTQKKIDTTLKLYDPLKRLSTLLFWSVSLSLGSAIYNISLGLFDHWILATFALFLAIFTLVMFVISLRQLRINITAWFDQLETIQEKDH